MISDRSELRVLPGFVVLFIRSICSIGLARVGQRESERETERERDSEREREIESPTPDNRPCVASI